MSCRRRATPSPLATQHWPPPTPCTRSGCGSGPRRRPRPRMRGLPARCRSGRRARGRRQLQRRAQRRRQWRPCRCRRRRRRQRACRLPRPLRRTASRPSTRPPQRQWRRRPGEPNRVQPHVTRDALKTTGAERMTRDPPSQCRRSSGDQPVRKFGLYDMVTGNRCCANVSGGDATPVYTAVAVAAASVFGSCSKEIDTAVAAVQSSKTGLRWGRAPMAAARWPASQVAGRRRRLRCVAMPQAEPG